MLTICLISLHLFAGFINVPAGGFTLSSSVFCRLGKSERQSTLASNCECRYVVCAAAVC